MKNVENITRLISEAVIDGLNRQWWRENPNFGKEPDYGKAANLVRSITDTILSDKVIGMYFSEPSNSIDDLHDLVESEVDDMIPYDDDIEVWNLLTSDAVRHAEMVNSIFWACMKKYRGDERPSVDSIRGDIDRLNDRMATDDIYGDKARQSKYNVIGHVRNNDSYTYGKWKNSGEKEPMFDFARRSYSRMFGKD